MNMQLLFGDCLETLKTLPDNSVDSVVTDPPYGWRFMGAAWDGADIDKLAKSGRRADHNGDGHYIGTDGVRRKIRDTTAESAGKYDQSLKGNIAFQFFTEQWAKETYRVLKPGGHMLVFCGPRTYHRMASGVEDAGFEIRDQLQWLFGQGFPKSYNGEWGGTALKPANEPIVLARKPIEGAVAKNFEKYGTGGLNIDESRIATEDKIASTPNPNIKGNAFKSDNSERERDSLYTQHTQGRFPANVLFDEEAAGILGEPSRFFYVAKASKRERGEGNNHPTVKPVTLMRYLIRLITPRGGTVLDPFMGSGTTGVACVRDGFEFIGCEMNEEYVEIARRRIEHHEVSA